MSRDSAVPGIGTEAPSGKPENTPVTDACPAISTYTASDEIDVCEVLLSNVTPLAIATAPDTPMVSDDEQSPSTFKSTANTASSCKSRLCAVMPQAAAPTPANSTTVKPRTTTSASVVAPDTTKLPLTDEASSCPVHVPPAVAVTKLVSTVLPEWPYVTPPSKVLSPATETAAPGATSEVPPVKCVLSAVMPNKYDGVSDENVTGQSNRTAPAALREVASI